MRETTWPGQPKSSKDHGKKSGLCSGSNKASGGIILGSARSYFVCSFITSVCSILFLLREKSVRVRDSKKDG